MGAMKLKEGCKGSGFAAEKRSKEVSRAKAMPQHPKPRPAPKRCCGLPKTAPCLTAQRRRIAPMNNRPTDVGRDLCLVSPKSPRNNWWNQAKPERFSGRAE